MSRDPLLSRRRRAALRSALREFRITLLLLFLLVAPIVHYFRIGGLAAFSLAIVLQYLHEFVKAYNKAYDDLATLADESAPENAAARRAVPNAHASNDHELVDRDERRPWRFTQYLLAGAKWLAIVVFITWVLFSVAIYIYR